jgi:hypothetical protein
MNEKEVIKIVAESEISQFVTISKEVSQIVPV